MSTDADKMGTLHHQLSTLDELFKEVAIQYEAAAATLREGLLPDRTPGFQLDAARKVFTDTLSVLSDVGDAYGLAPVSQNASLPSAVSYLNTVKEAKHELERQQKLLAGANMVLAEAKLITHVQDTSVLEPIENAIDQSQNSLDNTDLGVAQDLVDGAHTLSKLIAYTNHRDSLSDDEYDSFRQQIEDAFGRPVLRDIDRGRVVFSSTFSEESDSFYEEDQLDTQNDIIDIVDESEDELNESIMNGSEYYQEESTIEEPETTEVDQQVLETEVIEDTEVYDETMHDEHEPFWPPTIEEPSDELPETLNGEFEIDEDFNPEEDTITGRLS